ncbi:MAG: sel1 repeat family protein [Gammaproteobacteria bacterium]|nr:sel1 repeat family protein [Gammaproteobacteria bacterium]MBU1655209.1 sel1 repeat family protein [Gammaproteobacteria bacterium]MBU1961113.1 sel1 repeat family protein [Gammaproteobacteria bacterium]
MDRFISRLPWLLGILLTCVEIAKAGEATFLQGLDAYRKQQFTQAGLYWRQSMAEGSPTAKYNVGLMQDQGLGLKTPPSEALILYQQAANEGIAEAQLNLGVLHYLGRGTPQSYPQAITWFSKSAQQGNAMARHNLGVMHAHGLGVKKDTAKAMDWFTQAAKADLPEAHLNLALLLMETGKDKKAPRHWLERAAKQGLAEAQCYLALSLSDGSETGQDKKAARHWFQLATNQSHPASSYNLAVMLVSGEGGTKDESEAVRLLQEAARKGFAPANGLLGLMTEEGRGGLVANPDQAAELYAKSPEDWAMARRTRLMEALECRKHAQARLLGLDIACSRRHEVRRATDRLGLKPILLEDDLASDRYEANKLFQGATELFIFYEGDRFGLAEIRMKPGVTPDGIHRLVEQLKGEYGRPLIALGEPHKRGRLLVKWLLSDGIALEVRREWPDGTVYISYQQPSDQPRKQPAQDRAP